MSMEKLKSFKSFRARHVDMAGEENVKELLHAQAHIWNHIFSFINSMSLKCAIQLGIPDVIHRHGGPMTLSELATCLPVNPGKTQCVYRLMRVLVHSGFFERRSTDCAGESSYALTEASKLLVRDNPLSVTPFLLSMLDSDLTRPWDLLAAWFGGDSPTPFQAAHGEPFFEFGADKPELGVFFNDAMASDARLVTSVVIEKCGGVFEDVRSLVDVGGGTGTVARAVIDAFPGLECTVLDLPHVVAGLTGDNNLKFVAGDMFKAVPPADAILLKWILHDWSDNESVEILKKCKEAIDANDNKNGKVIIIDMMVDNEEAKADDESYETQLFFDMLMMILVTGRERNEKEWAKLFKDAGFSNYKITPILGLRSLIEVYP